jgi:uncharacterized protein
MRETSERPLARRVVLLVPGIGNSGPSHWQSLWEAEDEQCKRVHQRDWDHPVYVDWMAALEIAVREAGPKPLIVAHSLGCLLVARWLSQTSQEIAAAFLVAVPDPDGANFPQQATGFSPVPPVQLPCASMVVASTDDPYGDITYSRRCADFWGSRFVNIGNAGHINAASGLGEWSQGRLLLERLTAEVV